VNQVQVFIATSLDGYIATVTGQVDWLLSDQDYGYTDFYTAVGTVIMGRKTYEQVLSFAEYPYAQKQGFVVSRTRQGEQDQYVRFVSGDLPEWVVSLRENSQGHLWLVGGGTLIGSFAEHHLIDRLILSIHPVLLGQGIPLLQTSKLLAQWFQLQEVIPYESGVLQVIYTAP
jgi:dihydrofolate reductase